MSALVAREDLHQAVKNLQKYIDEDKIYQNNKDEDKIYQNNKDESDFDDFCINHCRDIDIVLNYARTAYELLTGKDMEV